MPETRQAVGPEQHRELLSLLSHQRKAVDAVQLARNVLFENASPGERTSEAFRLVAQAERLLVQDGYELACALMDEPELPAVSVVLPPPLPVSGVLPATRATPLPSIEALLSDRQLAAGAQTALFNAGQEK